MIIPNNIKRILSIFIVWAIVLPKISNAIEYNNVSFKTTNKDTVINLITKDTTFEEAYPKDSIVKNNLFSFKKKWITTKPLDEDSAIAISEKLLTENPIFQENWDNEQVFTYENVTYADLPENITIPLVAPGEKFQLTWYGNLNFKYGWRWGRMHRGLDLFLRTGDTVVAAFNGVVRYARFNASGFGNCVVVRHLNGLETVYGHLSKILVEENQYVQAGETLGLGGTTGRSNGPHLHFETRYKDFSIDPELYADIKSGVLLSDIFNLKKSNLQALRYPSVVVSYKKGKYSKKYIKKKPARKSAIRKKKSKIPAKNKFISKKKKAVSKKPIKKTSAKKKLSTAKKTTKSKKKK
jgi:murein DD-endopeptidase MepM/ murein hydrolase activator NlpD